MTLFLALFGVGRAQTTVEIGDGTVTQYYVPIGTLYNYSITEQLYTADEIGMAGTISSISFNYAVTTAKDFPITVYMANVDAADLSEGISLADADEVFDGTLSVTEAGWATINLDTPFAYDGTSNLLIGVNKGYVQWYSGQTWYGTAIENMARYSQQDGSAYDLTTIPANKSANRPNIQMEITASGANICYKPKNVAIEYTGGTTATVTWTGDASQYNIDVNGTVTNNVTSPYTLTGLNLATTYEVKVQANCGGGDLSDWTSPKSFATDICLPENQCNLTFVLKDTYGDGWNGNAIQVKDVETGIIIATLANQDLDGTTGEETQTVELAVCDGREIEFSWIAGSYPGETEYTVTDINNEVVLEGSGAFDTFTVQISCTPVTCARPTDLAVNYEGGLTAEVTWSGDATTYNIDVNGTVTTGVTSPYTLSGLELATDYSVMVQANCGSDGLSNWTSPVSFTTDLCLPENMCTLTIELEDSYGDGWNGAYFLVYDYVSDDDNTLLDYFTLDSGDSGTYTLDVCDGRTLAFYWSSGNYDDECSYMVYDNLGDVIYSGTGTMSGATLHTMNCNSTCRVPTDFAFSAVSGNSATLSWTENGEATEWVIAYMAETDTETTYIDVTENPYTLEGLTPLTTYYAMVRSVCEDGTEKWSETISFFTLEACPAPAVTVEPYPFEANISWTGFSESYDLKYAEYEYTGEPDWVIYDNGTLAANVGNSTPGQWTWGVMYPADSFNGNFLTKVAYYEVANQYYSYNNITMKVYQGGDTAPGTLLGAENITTVNTGGMREIALSAPIEVDPEQNVWITFTTVATYCMAMSQQDGGANSRWFLNNDSWVDFGTLYTTGATYSFMIRGCFEEYNFATVPWTTETDVESPYTLDVDPSTGYVVAVKGNCGTDGSSRWSYIVFTTPSACDAPIDLEVTDITYNSATLNWMGYQDGYNVRYRKTSTFFETFENGIPDTWTTIDADADGNTWTGINEFQEANGYYTDLDLSDWAYAGSNAAISPTAINNVGGGYTSLDSDHWLITPSLELGGTLRFYASALGNYGDEFEVLLSTTTTETDAFTVELQAMDTPGGDFVLVEIDLSAYEGQQGFIAIHHVFEDGYILVIDNFGLFTEDEAWVEEDVRDTNLEITGLEPNSSYEWQVRGENDECTGGEEDGYTDWSELATFNTPVIPAQTIELAAGWNWVSISKEITMADLKAAIIAANPGARPVIKSKGNGQTTYTG
ncbi:MAG: fibronectin type III domain-containing protein, partial [Bacteroidales bacterium]|nr:fibronectin type III domain-containing protein [Bacteroidales bacterium]